MRRLRTGSGRLLSAILGVTVLGGLVVAAPLVTASPAAAVTNNGLATFNPTSGTSATNFALGFPTTPSCVGDTASAGYNWSTFMVPLGTDIGTLKFDPNGITTQVAGQYRQSLLSAAGNTVAMQPTNIAGGPGQPGLITGIPQFTFSFNSPGDIPAGAYSVGLACTTTGGTIVDTYWSRPMTVTTNTTTGGPAQINWFQGHVQNFVSLVSVTPGDGTLTVAFSTPAADPAITSYTLAATPQGGGPTLVVTGTASPITIGGLTNGTTYDLALTATNAVGTGAAVTTTGTPTPPARPGVTALTAMAGNGTVDLTWVAPTGIAPTGYSLVITPSGGSPTAVSLPAGSTSYTATTLLTGGCHVSFTATITPLHPAPYLAAPTTVTATTLCGLGVLQDIEVTRPVGALVLTQVCGSYGSLGAETAQLGFPAGLAAAGAVNSSTVEAPTPGGSTPTQGVGGPGDPVRNQYPYPVLADGTANPTYPTNCGVALGRGDFVRSGAAGGQFFAVDGRLNQVTVVDTRGLDNGWNATASVSDFVSGPGKRFSGSQLGWTPVRTDDSDPFTDALGNTYDQVTSSGPAIAPNTAVAQGLSTNRTLLRAAPFSTTGPATSTGGMGTAIADARLKLLIPVTAQSGTYTATLTFTVL